MGSIRRKLHNDGVIRTEVKMKTKLPSKKIKRRGDDDVEHSSSSATALRIAAAT